MDIYLWTLVCNLFITNLKTTQNLNLEGKNIDI